MGTAGNWGSESKGFIDTRVQERHPRKPLPVDRIFSAQKRGINFLLEAFVVGGVDQEIIPQVGERDGGGVGSVGFR